jgi:hypothetical protein
MTEPTDQREDFQKESASCDAVGKSPRKRPVILGILGLLMGVLALGLAVIPAMVIGRDLQLPFADAKKDRMAAEPIPEREGGVTIKIKKLSVNFGGRVPAKKEPAPAPPEITKDPIRWFTISAVVCALIGLSLSSIGQLREKHTALTISSMGCCAAAITWQYFAFGIAVGAAAAAFLIVLAMLASALN